MPRPSEGSDPLPEFPYFVDPMTDGVFERSDNVCRCCGQTRGYVYVRDPWGSDESLESAICPWCIASGDAARMFDVEFVNRDGIGGYGAWETVSEDVKERLATRTPGFIGWQDERWFTHCGDAAVYLGRAGHEELTGEWAEAVATIRADKKLDDERWSVYVQALDRDGDCSAYVFRCRHCGALGGYSDCNEER